MSPGKTDGSAVSAQISGYLGSLPERVRSDLTAVQHIMERVLPRGRRWFLDGKDERGKTVSNPSIGYGEQALRYADGSTTPFYQVGVSANTSGLSVYIMGLTDRAYLPATYGKTIGKATVTGYCIKFRSLQQVDLAVLEAALRDGVARTTAAS